MGSYSRVICFILIFTCILNPVVPAFAVTGERREERRNENDEKALTGSRVLSNSLAFYARLQELEAADRKLEAAVSGGDHEVEVALALKEVGSQAVLRHKASKEFQEALIDSGFFAFLVAKQLRKARIQSREEAQDALLRLSGLSPGLAMEEKISFIEEIIAELKTLFKDVATEKVLSNRIYKKSADTLGISCDLFERMIKAWKDSDNMKSDYDGLKILFLEKIRSFNKDEEFIGRVFKHFSEENFEPAASPLLENFRSGVLPSPKIKGEITELENAIADPPLEDDKTERDVEMVKIEVDAATTPTGFQSSVLVQRLQQKFFQKLSFSQRLHSAVKYLFKMKKYDELMQLMSESSVAQDRNWSHWMEYIAKKSLNLDEKTQEKILNDLVHKVLSKKESSQNPDHIWLYGALSSWINNLHYYKIHYLRDRYYSNKTVSVLFSAFATFLALVKVVTEQVPTYLEVGSMSTIVVLAIFTSMISQRAKPKLDKAEQEKLLSYEQALKSLPLNAELFDRPESLFLLASLADKVSVSSEGLNSARNAFARHLDEKDFSILKPEEKAVWVGVLVYVGSQLNLDFIIRRHLLSDPDIQNHPLYSTWVESLRSKKEKTVVEKINARRGVPRSIECELLLKKMKTGME